MKKLIIAAFMILITMSCTENQRAKNFAGKQTVNLRPGEILINVTWKDDNMWLLTEDTTSHVKYFRENSSWVKFSGQIIIK